MVRHFEHECAERYDRLKRKGCCCVAANHVHDAIETANYSLSTIQASLQRNIAGVPQTMGDSIARYCRHIRDLAVDVSCDTRLDFPSRLLMSRNPGGIIHGVENCCSDWIMANVYSIQQHHDES